MMCLARAMTLLLLLPATDPTLRLPPEEPSQLADLTLYVTRKYHGGRCVNALFDGRPRELSRVLPLLHSNWSVFLPCPFPEADRLPLAPLEEPGIHLHLNCFNVLLLGAGPYLRQTHRLLYPVWGTQYSEAGWSSGPDRHLVLTQGPLNTTEALLLLRYMFDRGDVDVVLAGEEGGQVKLYTYFPFGADGSSCPEQNNRVVLIAVWKNGSIGRTDLYPEKVPHKFQGCKLPTVAVKYAPFVNIVDTGLEGIDVSVVDTLNEWLNTTLDINIYTHPNGWFFRNEDGKVIGSLRDLREGKAWIHISRISNAPFHYNAMSVRVPYAYYSMCLYCPNPLKVEPWKLIYLAFSSPLWLCFVASIFIFPSSFYFINRKEGSGADRGFGELSGCFVKMWCALMGNSTGSQPKRGLLRLMFAAWLFYTTHIDLAYVGTLTGMISGGVVESRVSEPQHVVDKGLRTVLNSYYEPQISYFKKSSIGPLFQNYETTNNPGRSAEDMSRFRNLCLVDSNIWFNYLIASKKAPIYRTPMELYSYRGMGLALRRNHFFTRRTDQFAWRLISSGLVRHYISNFTKPLWEDAGLAAREFEPVTLSALSGPFFLLVLGVVLSLVVFINEILYSKLAGRINFKIKLRMNW